ncbi:hypothetical protein [Arthrobacter sp. NA-172]|uniref:hypothetical protein n=1 Tax=Arthrobacter sp. NA-172 TaxID=3367524 RepID=UPI0037554146
MTAIAGEAVFHPGALLDLAEQLQCTTIPRGYALTFMEMLQARIERIISAIGNNDAEDAMDAVLKCSPPAVHVRRAIQFWVLKKPVACAIRLPFGHVKYPSVRHF